MKTARTATTSWVDRGIVLGLIVIYIAAFPFLRRLIGDSAAALSAFPVAAAGWYFGFTSGVLHSLILSAINLVLLIVFPHPDGSLAVSKDFIPGTILLILVGLIAGRLHKVLKDRKTVEAELRSRERFLTKLSQITTKILAADEFGAILEQLAYDMADLFKADACYITRWDAIHMQAIPVFSTQQLDPPYATFQFEPGEPNLTTSVLEAGRAIPVEDAQNSPLVSRRLQPMLPTRSLMGIPLMVGNRKLGAALIAFNRQHSFTPDELRRAEQAGGQIALALWDVQQETELQRRLRESNALADIGRALSETEHVGLDNVLQLIVNSAKELITGAEQVVIHLLDDDKNFLIPRAVTGVEKPEEGKMNMRLGEGVAGQVIAEGIIVNIADVETDLRFLRQDIPPRFSSLMVAPVQSGKARTGTISVQSKKKHAFSNDDMHLLGSLGTQASIAIENAHLLETTQQGLKEINALYHITQGLVASLDTEQLMKDVVELLQQNFGYYHVQIYGVEAETGDLVIKHSSGEVGKQIMASGSRLKAGTGIIGHAAETGKPFVTNNVRSVVFYAASPYLPLTQSELSVPIMVGERVLGVLDVQNAPPVRLTERDLQLVSTVADQLAVALQKASLYSDLQASLAQEKAMQSQLIQSERLALVGRLLASVSHELNNPLQAIQNALFLLQEEKGLSIQGRQDLQIVLSETERMAGLIERLRTSYRSTRVEDLQPVHINNVIEDVHALMSTHLRHRKIAFEFHPDPDLPLIAGLPDQIRQVILNLLMNGVEAMPSGGRLTVSTEFPDKRDVLITVSDTGAGIDPNILPHIFDAFVTSKESGTGLGLTITYDIIHRHNGRIRAENNPDRGATFKIWLPAYAQEDLT